MFKIKVAATSANLGPGFDSLGASVDLYNEYSFKEIESGLVIEGCPKKYATKNNLVYRSMEKVFQKAGKSPSGVEIKIKADIPISRGLGSSAACIVAGVKGANNLIGNALDEKTLLKIAVEIEGHPDNVVPAFYGGIWASIYEGEELICEQIPLANELKWVALVPDKPLSTEEARQALPSEIPFKDGVFNVSHVSLLILALVNGNNKLLKYGVEDKIHQPYREKLMPHFKDLKKRAYENQALAVFVSGAGPTIMCIIEKENVGFVESMKTEGISVIEV